MLPVPPEFPDIWLLEECPEDTVCVTEEDHTRLIHWVWQVERMFETIRTTCPGVEFRPEDLSGSPPP